MAVQTACPRVGEFEQMLKQRITAAASETLLGHLEGCPRCWETIAPLLESDTLLSGVALSRAKLAPRLVEDLLALDASHSTQDLITRSAVETGTDERDESWPVPHDGELGMLGHYQLESRLGRGGMGAVYLATDTRLDRQVALKVMLPKFAASPSAKERFLREARAAAKISHDNVVTVLEADERDGVPYIAMQFLQGSTLDDELQKKTVYRIPQIVRIAAETAAGLAAAHAIGLVHRDVKPGNLWLEAATGRVKVLDFGLAKPVDAATEITKNGALVGTPAFMSPEQARGQKVDGRTDLFSLGTVLYRLCTGKLPFEGPSTMAVLMALGNDEPTPVHVLNPEVPLALSNLIRQLLAKNADDRPRSAAEVVERLQNLQNPPRPQGKSTKWVAAGFAALLAVAVAGTIIIIKNKDGTETKIEVPDGATVTVQDIDGNVLAVVSDAEDAAWEKSVAGMTPEQQTLAVTARLKQKNPKFDEKSISFTIEKGLVVGVDVRNASELADVKPIRALADLKVLTLDGGFRNPCDISPLKGMKLTDVHFNGCPLRDVSPLAGMPLKHCYFWGNMTTDLSPLAGLKLVRTNVGHSMQKDLSVFKGMPLEFICMNLSAVDDLTALKDCPLTTLEISNTKITDLSPMRGKQIVSLAIDGSEIKDLSVLKSMPLKTLFIDNPLSHRELLLSIPTLNSINRTPAAEVLKLPAPIPVGERGLAEWVLRAGGFIRLHGGANELTRTADLPAGSVTVTAVMFFQNTTVADASLEHFAKLPKLQALVLYATPITDAGLVHLKPLTGLTRLDLGSTRITDTGLENIRPMKALNELCLHYTAVSGPWLANLREFPALQTLNLNGAVTDEGLVQLVGCKKLKDLSLDSSKITDAGLEVLVKIPTLIRINVKNTKVTAKGLAAFHTARPKIQIEHDGGSIAAEK